MHLSEIRALGYTAAGRYIIIVALSAFELPNPLHSTQVRRRQSVRSYGESLKAFQCTQTLRGVCRSFRVIV